MKLYMYEKKRLKEFPILTPPPSSLLPLINDPFLMVVYDIMKKL